MTATSHNQVSFVIIGFCQTDEPSFACAMRKRADSYFFNSQNLLKLGLTKVVKVGASTRRAFALPCAALCEPKSGAKPSLRTTTSARGLLHAFRRRVPACLLPGLFTSSPLGLPRALEVRTRLDGLTLPGTGPHVQFPSPL
jgi:hypothetical protein